MTDTRTLTIWQQNINKSLLAQLDTLSTIKKDYDVVLIQEPYFDFKGLSRANAHFTVIGPSKHRDHHATKPSRSIILVNKALDSSSWTSIDMPSPDITAIQVTGPFGTIRIFNVYN